MVKKPTKKSKTSKSKKPVKKSKSQNPRKCRTFQVKRKVGKKVITVRRKICRNPTTNESYDKKVELYLQNSPYFQFLYNKYGDEIDERSARIYAANHSLKLEDLELEKDNNGRFSTLEFVQALGY